MVLESECFHSVGAFEVYLLKVSALKLSHPSVCSVFQNFSRFFLLRHSLLMGEGEGEGEELKYFNKFFIPLPSIPSHQGRGNLAFTKPSLI